MGEKLNKEKEKESKEENEQKIMPKEEIMDKEQMAVKKWLTETVRLKNYYPVFVEHGYESLAMIKTISDKSELENIGIKKLGHQTRILAKIKDLDLNANNNADRMGS